MAECETCKRDPCVCPEVLLVRALLRLGDDGGPHVDDIPEMPAPVEDGPYGKDKEFPASIPYPNPEARCPRCLWHHNDCVCHLHPDAREDDHAGGQLEP